MRSKDLIHVRSATAHGIRSLAIGSMIISLVIGQPAWSQVGHEVPAVIDSLAGKRAPVRSAEGGITPGTVETGVTGEFSSAAFDGGDRFQTFVFSSDVGRFFTRYHEVGARFDIVASDGSPGTAAVLGVSSFHLPLRGASIPFVSFAAGAVVANDGHFQLSLGGGHKGFLSDTAALRMEYRYDRRFFELGHLSTHRVVFGVSAFAGPRYH